MDKNSPENPGLENPGPKNPGQDRPDRLGLASIDHAEYDALADLFLGDGGYAPEPIFSDDESNDEIAVEATEQEELPTHDTHTPVLQLTRHEDDAELGTSTPDQDIHHEHYAQDPAHEPFEIPGAGLHILETLAATDAQAAELLAELMGEELHNEDSIGQQLDAGEIEFIPMPDPTVEVVVLGHLPVRATLWARQYACNQAKELCETVALVRAASGSTSVDLITDGQSISVRTFTDIDDALVAVSKLADRVIMRVDEASEPELLDRPEIEEITILTGADEAAVVASYRLIKTLDATLGERYIEGEGPTLRVAVMGAGREMAMDACTKLGNAVETFLQRPIEIIIGSGRIDATGTTNLYRDSISHPASHILDALVLAAADNSEPAPLSIASPEIETELETETQLPEPTAASTIEMKPVKVKFPELKPQSSAPDTTSPANEQNDNSSDNSDTCEEDAPTMRDGLCALIPGLNPIEARCPKAPGVDLALDSKGRLHLIVSDADSNDAMNRLLAAQAWARNNLGLLIRAEPELAAPSADRDINTDAMMHLISIDPRSIREIYDTPVRIYSLARVKVGNIIAQVATPIN